MAVSKGERNINIFFVKQVARRIEHSTASVNSTQMVSYEYEDKEREIICFDANMIQVWDHLEDFFYTR